jgi:predicted ATPase
MSLQSIRVRNFKAIIDSRVVRLGPLTAFIGNNGSGKSSLIEALETWQAIVRSGLDTAMGRWLGIEHARHKAMEARERAGKQVNPIVFEARLRTSTKKTTRCEMRINNDPAANRMFIASERLTFADGTFVARDPASNSATGRSMLSAANLQYKDEARQISDWEFLTLQPDSMGRPQPQQRTSGGVRLQKDGGNIADYLLEIQQLSPSAFDGIVQTMAYVLPYARDLQPSVTSELERKTYLQLTESDFKVPGWMLSTGTLRVLALLAVLRHPRPPPLLVVEEIENGLDPRSIHLLVEEIRTAVQSGITQVIITTHSPYLLDLLKLEQIVVVSRDGSGQPRFHRLRDSESLQRWSEEFSPGRLYTMGKLHDAAQ